MLINHLLELLQKGSNASNVIANCHCDICHRLVDVRVLLDQVMELHKVLLVRTACEFAPKALEVSATHGAVAKKRINRLEIDIHQNHLVVVAACLFANKGWTDL